MEAVRRTTRSRKGDEPKMKPGEIAAISKFRKAAETKYGQTETDAEDGPDGEGEEGEEYANIWNVNLTSMEQNGGFLIGKDADVVSFEEHKLKKGMIGWIREEFRKAGWAMLCGPADETRKKASAGVWGHTR